MEVFRLTRERFALPLSGWGAALRGARWNPIGTEVIYTAQNRSLAMAEIAVHFTLATLPTDYVMLTIHVPEDVSIQEITPSELPEDWNQFPHPMSTQEIGRQFLSENRYGLLKLPSVVTQGDFNFLINPKHPDFPRISVVEMVPFPFDRRIFQLK